MFLSIRGRQARPDRVTPSFARARGGYWLLCFVIAIFSRSVVAQSPAPLPLVEAEELALASEPGREALLAQSAALRARSVSVGQLLDPQARIGLLNFPIQSGGFSTEGMTQVQLGIRQAFPKGDSRALNTQLMGSRAEQMASRADARARDVRVAVRQLWLEAFYWSRAASLVTELRPLFADLATISTSLFSVGRESQQAVMRAELELSRVDDRLLQIETQGLAARAALGQWVGAAASRPLPAGLPAWPKPPDWEILRERLEQHPAVQAAKTNALAGNHAVELAREQFKPGWMVDLGYGYRDGNLPDGTPRSDFFSLMVSVDLPLRRRNRQSQELEAALQERRAAEQSEVELTRRMASELQREYDRWQLLTRRLNGYDERILRQAQGTAAAALVAYQSDAGELDAVLHGYIDQLETRLNYARLQVDRAQSFSLLANLGGIAP